MDALQNLPSRGNLASTSGPILSRAPKAYVADHTTDPPEDQKICTDPENILIQCLQKRQGAGGSGKGRQGKGAGGAKRPADAAAEHGNAKRGSHEGGTSGEGGSGRSTVYSPEQLRARTIPELIDILKARGLSGSRGKKEELVQRILEAQERARKAAQPR